MAQRNGQHNLRTITLVVALLTAPACLERPRGTGHGSHANTSRTTTSSQGSSGRLVTALNPLEQDTSDPSAEAIRQYIDILDKVDAKNRTELTDFGQLADGPEVKLDSETWARRFLSDAASPYRAGLAVKRSTHPTEGDLPDVLRHEYDLSVDQESNLPSVTIHMVVEETVGWIRIRPTRSDMDLRTVTVPNRVAAIGWIAQRVLRLQGTHRGRTNEDAAHSWVFLYKNLEEGARFSTDPSQRVTVMWSWADRVDGGIRGGQPYFLGHKHHEPAGGKLIFLNPDHWFDGKCWDTYRRR